MAERLDSIEEKRQRYSELRSMICDFVTTYVDQIALELKRDEIAYKEKIDFFIKLVGQKLTEVKQLDEKIQSLTPVDELNEHFKTSLNFNFKVLNKIIDATKALAGSDEEFIFQKLDQFLPVLQMPTSFCTSMERPKKGTPKTTPHQRVFELPSVEKRAIEDISSECTKEAKHSGIGQRQRVFKLPVLELPTFDGNMLNWFDFWTTFETEIHDDHTMTNAQKFGYLKALLIGKDFNFIMKMVTNSDVNYETAVAALKSRYGDVGKSKCGI